MQVLQLIMRYLKLTLFFPEPKELIIVNYNIIWIVLRDLKLSLMNNWSADFPCTPVILYSIRLTVTVTRYILLTVIV